MQIAADNCSVFVIISMNMGLNGRRNLSYVKALEKFGFSAEASSSCCDAGSLCGS